MALSPLSLRRLLLAVAAFCALLGAAAPVSADTALGIAAPAMAKAASPAAEPFHWEPRVDFLAAHSPLLLHAVTEVTHNTTLRTRVRVVQACRRSDTSEQVCLRERRRAVLLYSFSLRARPSRLVRTGIAPPA